MSGDQWMFRVDGIGDVHRRNTQCATFCQPVVVIDPEDREQVERLGEALRLPTVDFLMDNLSRALREFANPKPEVLRHYVALGGENVRSVCGKVWKPTDNVTVIGDCETCAEIVSKGWMA